MQSLPQDKLILIASEVQYLAACLKVLSGFIEYFPFAISEEAFRRFQEYKSKYDIFHNRYEKIGSILTDSNSPGKLITENLTELNQCLGEINENRIEFTQYLMSLFQEFQSDIKYRLLIEGMVPLYNSGIQLQKELANLYASEERPLNNQKYLESKETFEKSFFGRRNNNSVINCLMQCREELISDFPLEIIKRELGDQDFLEFQQWQRNVVYLQRQLEDFNCLVQGKEYQPSTFASISTWLSKKEENEDLMLLSNLLKPTSLNKALQRKIWFMNMDLQTAHRNMSFLNRYFNKRDLLEAVRIQRTIIIYRFWSRKFHTTILDGRNDVENPLTVAKLLEEMKSIEDKQNQLRHGEMSTEEKASLESELESNIKELADKYGLSSLKIIFNIQSLSAHVKKMFFRKWFAEQKAYQIVQVLCDFVHEGDNSSKESAALVAALRRTKNNLRHEIRLEEEKLKAPLSYMKSCLSTFTLASVDYQLATLSTDFFDYLCTQCLPVSFLQQVPITENERSLLHLAVFLASNISISYYIGTLPITCSRVLLSQIDLLFRGGERIDNISRNLGLPLLESIERLTPEQLSGIVDWLKESIRFDELGVTEKIVEHETVIQLIMGLSIHLIVMGGQNVIPATLGYASGTIFRETAGWIVKNIAKACGASQEITSFSVVTANLLTYSHGYRFGWRWGQWLSPPLPRDAMPWEEACSTLFSREEKDQGKCFEERVVRERRNELLMRCHDDKIKSNSNECGDLNAHKIHSAFTTLTKKIQ